MIASLRRRETDSYRTLFWLVIGYVVGLAGSAISLVAGFALDLTPPLIGLAERVLALIALAWVGVLAWQVRPRRE